MESRARPHPAQSIVPWPGGQVGILPAVVVVDVGCGQERAGRARFVRDAFAQVGVAGIEGQGELRMVELMRAARPGRPSGCRDARPAACSRRRSRRRRPGRGRPGESPRPEPIARSACSVSVGQSAGMDHQALAAGGREPVDAPLQVVDRFFVSGRVGRAQVDAAARMVWPPQQPWALWIENPRSALGRASATGIGESAPEREGSRGTRRRGCGQIELGVEIDRADSRR